MELNITDKSTVDQVDEALANVGVSDEVRKIFKDNEVDGFTLKELTDTDLKEMIPGKVGVVRKLSVLLKEIKNPVDSPDTSVIDSSLPPFPSLQLDVSMVSVVSSASSPAAGPSCSTPISNGASRSLPIETQLPVFSQRVQGQLNKGCITADFDKFVEETAYFLLNQGDIRDRGSYQDYGRKLCLQYPCIGHPGKEPWTFFCRKLSQKLRNIRWRKRKRSDSEGSAQPSKAKRSLNLAAIHYDDEESMSLNEAISKMADEIAKPTAQWDRALLKRLARVTHKARRTDIAKLPNGTVSCLVEAFPLLNDEYFIKHEYEMLQSSAGERDLFIGLLGQLEDMLYERPTEETEDDNTTNEAAWLQVLLNLEKKLTPTKKQPLPPVLKVTDVMEAELSVKTPPRLLVIERQDSVQLMIVADGVSVPLSSTSVVDGMLRLLHCYYVWDLKYPSQYQMLGFLQVYALKDTTNGIKRGHLLTKFEKLFLSKADK